jgi:hypothetical protein
MSSKRQCGGGLNGILEGTGQEFQVKIFVRDIQLFASFTTLVVPSTKSDYFRHRRISMPLREIQGMSQQHPTLTLRTIPLCTCWLGAILT